MINDLEVTLTNASEIIFKLKRDLNSYELIKEFDLLGDIYYEEHLFYINNGKGKFCRHIVDWELFNKHGIRKANDFVIVSEEEAIEYVEGTL